MFEPKTKEAIVKMLLNSDPTCYGTGKGSNSYYNYFSYSDNPLDILRVTGHACCYSIQYYTGIKDGGFGLVYRHNNCEREDLLDWFQFMTDPNESPFGEWINLLVPQNSEIVNDVNIHCLQFHFRYGVILDNIDVPINIFVNFYKMLRMAGEHTERIKFWQKLVAEGISKLDALMIASLFYFAKNGNNPKVVYQPVSHSWLEQAFPTVWKNITAKRLIKENFLAYISARPNRYSPCDCIWYDKHTSHDQDRKFFRSLFAKEEIKKVKDPFRTSYDNGLSVSTTYSNLISLLPTLKEKINNG